jgi:hypothetical protein
MTYENDIDAFTLSPAFADGSYRLFVGTADAQLWVLDPAQLDWVTVTATAPAQVAPPAQVALPTPTPIQPDAPAEAAAPALTPAAAPLAGEPPVGLYYPEGSLGVVWDANTAMQEALGWAKEAQPDSSQAADQSFEHGRMIWVQAQDSIYVIYNDGSWERYADTFEDGMVERNPAIVPPGGKLQPERGFGKIWREQPQVRERIGWALAPETPADVQLHPFERGSMIRLGVAAYALLGEARGTWLR